MDAGALPDFVERARETYVRQLVEFAYVGREQARAKADADIDRLFPDGRPSDDLHVFTVVDEDGGAVGIAFFASIQRDDDRVAFVYAIEIDEAFRGRGFGRAAMLAIEAQARALGHSEIRLTVFGGNEAARGLYRSLGYKDVDVTMMKQLA